MTVWYVSNSQVLAEKKIFDRCTGIYRKIQCIFQTGHYGVIDTHTHIMYTFLDWIGRHENKHEVNAQYLFIDEIFVTIYDSTILYLGTRCLLNSNYIDNGKKTQIKRMVSFAKHHMQIYLFNFKNSMYMYVQITCIWLSSYDVNESYIFYM